MSSTDEKYLQIVLIGQIYHSLGIDELVYDPLGLIGVSRDGQITIYRNLSPGGNVNGSAKVKDQASKLSRDEVIDRELKNLKDKGYKIEKTVVLKETEFLIPGLVDTHIHAPQYTFTGTGYDLELLQWLETYTFPKESEFKSKDYATLSHTKVVKKTLSSGTTTACYFGTIHKQASVVLAETCIRLGQRAFVGKVPNLLRLDRNSPDYYIEETKDSIQDTKDFITHLQSLNSPLITPILTPRFVPSCTPALMKALGKLASTHNLPIQSHMSENKGEIEWVKELHPGVGYAGVYEKFGLLGSRTVMAHCIHMTEEERELFLKTEVLELVGIAHCPSSNFSLHSGVLNVRRLFDQGFTKIGNFVFISGLGTDCAGGYSPSIMDSMRQALIASKVIHINSHEGKGPKYKALNYKQVFYLATLGGAKVMGLEDKIGNFKVGKQFDAIVVDTAFKLPKPMLLDGSEPAPGMDVFKHDDPWAIFEKFIYLGDDKLMARIYVDGKQVV